VLGCLVEKGATTPENYPLTMNALVAACNQTSNRDPVVTYRESAVTAALAALRERKLIRIVYPAHARVTKYRHVLEEVWALSPPEVAVLAVLLLRGDQTQSELATRTERYADPADFADMDGVSGVLDRLAGRPDPLVRLVPRRAGQREDRYTHLLGPTAAPGESGESPHPRVDGGEDSAEHEIESGFGPSSSQRILALEAETANLRWELGQMRQLLVRLLGESNPPSES
jgi:hypothetical protein